MDWAEFRILCDRRFFAGDIYLSRRELLITGLAQLRLNKLLDRHFRDVEHRVFYDASVVRGYC